MGELGARQLGALEVASDRARRARACRSCDRRAPAFRDAELLDDVAAGERHRRDLAGRARRVTSSRLASALVTLTPTPCRPPEKLYAELPPLSNLPPACSRVKTISSTLTSSSGCRPVGMPRPSSSTLTEPSACRVTSIARAVAGERLVGGVVDHLLDDVQRALGARVHARPLLDRLEALQDADRGLAVTRPWRGSPWPRILGWRPAATAAREGLQQSATMPMIPTAPARPLRPPRLADLPRRQRLRLDRRRGDVASPARRLGRRRHELRRHRRRVLALGARPRRRRVGNDHRQVAEAKRQARPHRPRDQGRQADGRRRTRACRRPTSGAPSRPRCSACRPMSSTSTSRTTTTPTPRSRRRWRRSPT